MLFCAAPIWSNSPKDNVCLKCGSKKSSKTLYSINESFGNSNGWVSRMCRHTQHGLVHVPVLKFKKRLHMSNRDDIRNGYLILEWNMFPGVVKNKKNGCPAFHQEKVPGNHLACRMISATLWLTSRYGNQWVSPRNGCRNPTLEGKTSHGFFERFVIEATSWRKSQVMTSFMEKHMGKWCFFLTFLIMGKYIIRIG